MALILVLVVLLQDGFEKQLEDLLPRLGAEEYAERAKAQEQLIKLVEKHPGAARKILKARIKEEKDPEVRSALENALRSLVPLKLILEVDGEAKVGRPIRFKVRIKNQTDEEQVIVKSLDGSDVGWRFPKYLSEFRHGNGDPVKMPGVGR
jgi:hypothetical protein